MKSKRKLWIPITAAVLAVALGAAALLAPRFLQPEPVAVYAVNMVGYTDYYSGTSESYGMVTTDKVQTAWVSDTQTITEILVYDGQKVKKGDVLYTYDTTLSDLALERKDLAIQQLEVTLKTAQAELKALKAMKPISYKENTATNTNKYTKSPSDKNLLGTVYSTTTGRSRLSPLYYWMEDGSGAMSSVVSTSLIEYLFTQAVGNDPQTIYVVFQSTDNNKTNTDYAQQYGLCFTKTWKEVPVETEPTEPPTESTPPESDPGESTPGESDPAESTPAESDPAESTPPESGPAESTPGEGESGDTQEPPEEEPATGEDPGSTELPGDGSAAEANSAVMALAAPSATQPSTEPTKPQTEKVFDGYAISFFEPSSVIEDNSSIDWNSGYTDAELKSLRTEKQAEITQLQFDIKMGKAELNIMKKEADSGQVLAQFDGTVTGVTAPLAAAEQNLPLMKVIGGGGYYVEGTVSELELNSVQLGQTITINSWDTGEMLQGTVVEVGRYPTEDSGYGTAGVSYYPYRVFIDQSANLMEGYFVSLSIPSAAAESGTLYLQNAFLRKDGSRSYVYVRSADGLLEKRYVEAGISLDGYMTPIYSGLTELDCIAFPYGNDLIEGAPTYEGTMDELYGY